MVRGVVVVVVALHALDVLKMHEVVVVHLKLLKVLIRLLVIDLLLLLVLVLVLLMLLLVRFGEFYAALFQGA